MPADILPKGYPKSKFIQFPNFEVNNNTIVEDATEQNWKIEICLYILIPLYYSTGQEQQQRVQFSFSATKNQLLFCLLVLISPSSLRILGTESIANVD